MYIINEEEELKCIMTGKEIFENYIGHFKTINNHKRLVMKYCFKVGLYKQALLHDLSKYSWIEFKTGIKYYNGNVSPNGIEKLSKGFSEAWLHHKGRNKHHFEYWIDYGINKGQGLVGMEMPKKYVIEMFIDRMCACMNYEKDKYTDKSPLIYYNKGKEHYMLHENTRRMLEMLLQKLADDGQKITLDFIKNKMLK